MNFQRLTTFFQKPIIRKKKQVNAPIDKWYEYSSMNDLHNPTLRAMKELHTGTEEIPKKKIGSA